MRYKILTILFFNVVLTVGAQASKNRSADALHAILKPHFIPFQDEKVSEITRRKQNLGKELFYDKKLSFSKQYSCNSCHDLLNYGSNGSCFLSELEKGQFFRDTPSLYNIKELMLMNSDGAFNSMEDKVTHSLFSTYEMNGVSKEKVEFQLQELHKYQKEFSELYPEENKLVPIVVDALCVFLDGLITPAPIDAFILGDMKALTAEQVEGGHLFNDKSCYSCHTGSNFGGQMIQKLGITEEWPNQNDLGYYHLKHQSDFKMFFRVAPLRNVSETAPYFHDRSSKKLWKAIRLMGKHERGLEISVQEAVKIQEFLKSLKGEIPLKYIKLN